MYKAANTPTQEELKRDQKSRALKHTPTPETYWLRLGPARIGERSQDWQDKPYRLVYDACSIIEDLQNQINEFEDQKKCFDAVATLGMYWRERAEAAEKAMNALNIQLAKKS
jgi:hypothetical protein